MGSKFIIRSNLLCIIWKICATIPMDNQVFLISLYLYCCQWACFTCLKLTFFLINSVNWGRIFSFKTWFIFFLHEFLSFSSSVSLSSSIFDMSFSSLSDSWLILKLPNSVTTILWNNKKKLITVLQKKQYLIKALIQMTILIPAWSSCYGKTRKCRNSKIEMKHKNIIRNIINKKLTRKYNYRINKKIYLNIALSDNPLSVNVPFLYPLKMSENKFSDIFRRIEKV